jgi:hypothetical protein
MRAADERLLASSANVRDDATLPNFPFAVIVVVALVQAEIHWAAWPTGGTHQDSVEGRAHHPLVVHVRSRERDCHRNASLVCQNVALGAALSTIGWIRAREVPPFGAFTMAPSREAHSQSMPRSTW